MTTKLTKDVYLKAAKGVTKRTHIQEAYFDNGGERCLIGHITKAALPKKQFKCVVDTYYSSYESEALDEIGELTGFEAAELVDFNDDPDTTHEEVQMFLLFGAAGAFKDLKKDEK